MKFLIPFKNILITAPINNFIWWLPGFSRYLTKQGVHITYVHRTPRRLRKIMAKNRGILLPIAIKWWRKKLKNIDHVFLWSGEYTGSEILKTVCREQEIPLSVVEAGYFPGIDFFIIDRKGINGLSSVIEDSLDWIEPQHIDAMQVIRKTQCKGLQYKGGGGYILIPLDSETYPENSLRNSRFKNMQEFINHCESNFPNKKLIFKTHPLDKTNYQTSHTLLDSGSFIDLALNADLIYGLNTSCLLQSLLLNAPTESIGKGFISTHAHQTEKLLAALVDKQIPIFADNMDYWIHKYCSKP